MPRAELGLFYERRFIPDYHVDKIDLHVHLISFRPTVNSLVLMQTGIYTLSSHFNRKECLSWKEVTVLVLVGARNFTNPHYELLQRDL